MRIASIVLGTLAAFAAAMPVQAAWLKATSRHFVVYSDTSVDALSRQTIELEQFDALLRRFQRSGADTDAEFNRVTVYVLPTIEAVRQLSGLSNTAGFYLPRVTGSVAFTPRSSMVDVYGGLNPRIILFHEYAHHFLLGNYTQAYPAWFGEGYAEFCSTASVREGALWLGGAANHRAYGLLGDKALSLDQLFAPPARMSARQTDSLYGLGWLMTHYLMLDADRRAQLGRYLTLFNAGTPSLAAAKEAFGDLKVLDRNLQAYLRRSRLPAVRVDPATLVIPKIDIRPLTGGEEALIAHRMESTRGVGPKTAAPLFARAAAAATPFGRDAEAQGWLAEMAYDAGRLDAAEAAADAAIAVAPKSSQALLYKARVHIARLLAAKVTDAAAWGEARSWIIKANRAQPDDAAALALFYESFLAQKAPPARSAISGLYRAANLVPQARGTRFLAARQLILDGDAPRARQVLRPLASDPHAGTDNAAVRLLALLDAGRTGQAAIDALEKAGDTAAAKGDPAAD